MYKWKKEGRLIHSGMFTDKWWMKQFTQTPSVLVFDTYIRIYFCSRPNPDSNGQYKSYLSYVDVDKNNLFQLSNIAENPVLTLGETGTFDEFGVYPASVINVDGDIRVYYGGNTRCVSVPFNAAIGVAISKNGGVLFERIGSGPVLSFSLDEPFVIGSPKIRFFNNKWYLWYSAGQKWFEQDGVKQPVYKIRCAVSDDGIKWEKMNKNLLPNILEENECQASADVIYKNGKYHMFFSYRFNFGFKEPGRGYRVGYATSLDLITWERNDEKAGFFPSSEGWDSESVSYLHLFEVNNKIAALYQGNYMGKDGIGLAFLESELI